MRKLFWWFAWSSIVHASTYWIIGEDYIDTVDGSGSPLHSWFLRPSSYGFDSKNCRVWAEESSAINIFGTDGYRKSTTVSGSIVSDRLSDSIFIRSGENLHQFNEDGTLVESKFDPDYSSVQRLVNAEPGFWALHHQPVRKNSLWVSRVSLQLENGKPILLSTGHDRWSTQKIFPDGTGGAWVGFTTATPTTAYSPAVAKIDSNGNVVLKRVFKERGLFFDGCPLPSGEFLLSRDIPSNSGFTVPVYSFLESIAVAGTSSTLYSAETNYFIDSVLCERDFVTMAERSIFGSDGSFLSRWDFGATQSYRLVRLRGRVQQIYHCKEDHHGP